MSGAAAEPPAAAVPDLPGGVAVVAGNGPSLAAISPGRVLASDAMFRINSFFLEPEYYLGRRVDLAMVAGDPRVVPFLAETLRRAAADYQLRAWSAPSPRVARLARRALQAPFRPLRYRDAATAAEVARLSAEYQARPTSGIETVLMAHAMGARRILLAGIDLYATPRRYAFEPGPRMRALMGGDLGRRSWDRRLHHPDLDRRMLDWLARRGEVELFRLAEETPLAALLDLAPRRPGPAPEHPPKPPIEDWAGWAGGWYPLRLLWLMRRLRGWHMKLTGER